MENSLSEQDRIDLNALIELTLTLNDEERASIESYISYESWVSRANSGIGHAIADAGFTLWAESYWPLITGSYEQTPLARSLAKAFGRQKMAEKALEWEEKFADALAVSMSLGEFEMATQHRNQYCCDLGKLAFDRGDFQKMNQYFDQIDLDRHYNYWEAIDAIKSFAECNSIDRLRQIIAHLDPVNINFYNDHGFVHALLSRGLEVEFWALIGTYVGDYPDTKENVFQVLGVRAAALLRDIPLAIRIIVSAPLSYDSLMLTLCEQLIETNDTHLLKAHYLERFTDLPLMGKAVNFVALATYASCAPPQEMEYILQWVARIDTMQECDGADLKIQITYRYLVFAWINRWDLQCTLTELESERDIYWPRLVPALAHHGNLALHDALNSLIMRLSPIRDWELGLFLEWEKSKLGQPNRLEDAFQEILQKFVNQGKPIKYSSISGLMRFTQCRWKNDAASVAIFDLIDWTQSYLTDYSLILNLKALARLGRMNEVILRLPYLGVDDRINGATSAISEFLKTKVAKG